MKAFYFAKDDRKLRYGDNREIGLGITHKVEGKIRVCHNGLHGSERLLDALTYAPGHHLYSVELSGTIDTCSDKAAASERTYLGYFNAEELLREFARKQALINVSKIQPYCPAKDYQIIVQWLETGDKEIQAAAWAAAEAVEAVEAAEAAARAAAWAAEAVEAAEAAARAAAWAAEAAEAAAWSAARAAARAAADEMLLSLVREATGWDI